MENFLGSWLLEKNEKFTDFLHCLGVPYLVCKFANWLPTTINICQEADEYTIETVTTFKTTKARFKPDEPFEETSMGDTNLKSLIRLENGVLHYQQSGKKEVNSKWEVNGETLNVVLTVEDVVCRRTYKRVEF
uniref:Fatty acid-binding protein homolog 1 n=2 Tax=Schistocephalus solidus TaxID=70667 RepID=A0A0X3PRQ0_SCHSO